MPVFEAVCLGLGGVGSAALMHLARRGVRVLGIDRFLPPHTHGSSHGHTRIIRQAYFEHPQYVPLLVESYAQWNNLEQLVGEKLYYQIGVLQVGPVSGNVVPGVQRAAREHQLPIEELSSQIMSTRWPHLAFREDLVGVLEAKAGYLLVEACVKNQIAAARAAGATVIAPSEVLSWDPGKPIRIKTNSETIFTNRLVIAAGPWAQTMLAELKLPLAIRRKSVFWFAAEKSFSVEQGYPAFLYELPEGVFYGFPEIDARGVKLAEHSGGQVVEDPLQVNRSLETGDELRIAAFREAFLPGVTGSLVDHQTCLYTMSPDEHFLVDFYPQVQNVVFAAGLSGHGFKFSPVLGQALAELALDGGTNLPTEFLALTRFP